MPRFTPLAVGAGLILGLGALMSSDALADSKLLARGRSEQPAFTVVERAEGFELRRYQARLVAEVEVSGDPATASSAGFRLLAGFIFGGKTRAEKVAMTSPVDMRATAEPEKIAITAPVDRQRRGERWVVTFTMPSKYTLETLPRPNDARVLIRELPAVIFAVRRSPAPRTTPRWPARSQPCGQPSPSPATASRHPRDLLALRRDRGPPDLCAATRSCSS